MKYIILTLILCLPLIGFGQIDFMYEITDEKDSYNFSTSDIHTKKIEIKGEEINSLLEYIHLYDSIETLEIWEYDQRILNKEQYKLI